MGFTLFQVRTVCSVASSQLVKEDVAVAQHSQEPLGLMEFPPSLQACRDDRGVGQQGVLNWESPGSGGRKTVICFMPPLYACLPQTHDNREHLAMMERILGPIPSRMIRKTR